MSDIAFITGIAGQDGAYLAKFLLDKGYEVHGLLRWDSASAADEGQSRLVELGLKDKGLIVHTGDISDANALTALIKKIKPTEIYNLAALSQVHVSFETPASTFDINAKGTLNILEAVRVLGMEKGVRIYQASSSEMFGSTPPPQNEQSAMMPCSPYGVAKLAAYHLARTYREAYGMFVANGILFNHESPLRGEDFVTRKIVRAVAEFEQGRSEPLMLGNLEAMRDWGYAGDFVEGMWMMLQHDFADDFVLASGEAHSVRTCVERAFSYIGVEIDWQGEGVEEQGIDAQTGRVLVTIDPQLFRPLEVNALLGDASKAAKTLGWAPQTDFEELIGIMINEERQLAVNTPKSWLKTG